MALRIRKADGSTIEVPADGHFVEIVNDFDGSVGMVLMQPEPGVVLTIKPGGADAQRYAGMFHKHGVRFAQRIINRRVGA